MKCQLWIPSVWRATMRKADAATAARNRSSGVRMPGTKRAIDGPTGRVIALIGLLIIAAAALRGYLPAHDYAARVQPGPGRAALAFVVVALSATLTLLAIAIIARLRDPRAMPPGPGGLSGTLGGRAGRPSWRVLLVGLAGARPGDHLLLTKPVGAGTGSGSVARAWRRPGGQTAPPGRLRRHARSPARQHDPDADFDRRGDAHHVPAATARGADGCVAGR